VDWLTEVSWTVGALIATPMFMSSGFIPQGIGVALVAIFTIAWTEHLVRSPNRDRDAMIMAGILGALALRGAVNRRKQD